jgi:hypothetical protein
VLGSLPWVICAYVIDQDKRSNLPLIVAGGYENCSCKSQRTGAVVVGMIMKVVRIMRINRMKAGRSEDKCPNEETEGPKCPAQRSPPNGENSRLAVP